MVGGGSHAVRVRVRGRVRDTYRVRVRVTEWSDWIQGCVNVAISGRVNGYIRCDRTHTHTHART